MPGEGLIRELLKAALPLLPQKVHHRPSLIVELNALADGHSTNPLKLACRSSPAVVMPR